MFFQSSTLTNGELADESAISRKRMLQTGRFRPHFQAMTKSSSRFEEHISTAPNSWRQMVYLCIEIKAWEVEHDPAYFGDLFAAAPAKTILAETLRDVPEGLLTALKKLAGFPLPTGGYVHFLRLLNEKASNRVLRHEKEITWLTIDVLRRLPKEIRCSNILNTLSSAEEADALHYVVSFLQRVLTDTQINRFYVAATRIRRQDQLGEFLISWLMKAPFPSPPWEGTEFLRPVASVTVLNDIRLTYQNCLKEYLLSVLRGESYFYEWTGNQQVIIQLDYDPIIGWMIDHIEGGISSREVSESIRREIEDTFSTVGINPKPDFQSVLRVLDNSLQAFT